MNSEKVEIERRFLVIGDRWSPSGNGVRFVQGYLSLDPERIVRVRLEGEIGKITVKGRKKGAAAPEFEYAIPAEDVEAMHRTVCVGSLVEKDRYTLRADDDHIWTVDLFAGENLGLILAEIELDNEEEVFTRPEWLGPEVTGDFRYANSNLAEKPYRRWPKEDR